MATRLLPSLVRDDIPWRDGALFWIDERAVPWSHADSNYGQSRDGWIADVVARGGDAAGFAQGLQRAGYATDPAYAEKLARVINTTLRLQRSATA